MPPAVGSAIVGPGSDLGARVDETNDEVVDWIRSHLLPIASLEPGSGDHDLEPLLRQLAAARIVGLGESAHGVHEFFVVKQRLVELLVRDLGFTVFALEASYAACQTINDYVLDGVGDPSTVLSNQRYLAWDTHEFVALIDWMRAHNQGVTRDRAVSFHGLDAGYNDVGRASLVDYLARLAPERLALVEPAFEALRQQEAKWPLATDDDVILSAAGPLGDLEVFLVDESDQLAARSSVAELARNRWFVHVMNQWVEPEWPREQHLTDNLVHVLEIERPGAKAVLWLHNSHVAVEAPSDSEPRMGWRLRQRYHDAYWCMAVEFGRGSFQTRLVTEDGLGDLVVTDMPAPPAGSLPWTLEQVGVPAFVLPLRGTPGADLGGWLNHPQLEHGGMWIHTDPRTLYEDVAIGEQYDSILFVDRISSAEPTPNALAAAQARVDF